MLHDARSTGARGVMGSEKAGEEDFPLLTTHHTSHSLAAGVAQHKDDWVRVRYADARRLQLDKIW